MRPSDVQGPLTGTVVVDFTHVLSGPFCTMLLADLGARVIKVEMPGKGDVSRQLGPFVGEKSAYFATFNRGKESVVFDLTLEQDRSVFGRLLEKTDVLVENFTPGVMDRLGFGWERLHGEYPRLIYAAISGFGRTGPLKNRKANDLVAQAMGGIMSVTGPEGGPPTRVGTGMGDMAAGIFAAVGICAALYHRELTGDGTLVDVSMMDCQVALLEHHIARWFLSGEVPAPMGNRHPSAAPFGVYKTADGHIALSTAIDKDFAVLAEIFGRPDLPTDPRFASISLRARHFEALDEVLVPIIRTKTTAHWLQAIEDAGLRAAPILDVKEIVNHPQTKARNMVVRTSDPATGELIMQGNPIKMPAFPDPDTRAPAPDLGADTGKVRKELG